MHGSDFFRCEDMITTIEKKIVSGISGKLENSWVETRFLSVVRSEKRENHLQRGRKIYLWINKS